MAMSQAFHAWLSMPLSLAVFLGAFFVVLGPLNGMYLFGANAIEDAPPPRGSPAFRYGLCAALYLAGEATIIFGCGLIVEPAWDWAVATTLSGAAALLMWVWLCKVYWKPRPSAEAAAGAEGGVDRIVSERFFDLAYRGVMVEVGAARPDFLSISSLYRSLRWKVIAIDANPAYADLYRAKGYELLQYACSDQDADDVDFTVATSDVAYRGGRVSTEAFSSLAIRGDYATLRDERKPDLNTHVIKVPVRRLDRVLQEHAPAVTHIDIVAVDVEGWELEVLRGLAFNRYRPKVVILENLFYDAAYRSFMAERGYVLWRLLAPNEVWVRRDLLWFGPRMAARVQTGAMTMLGCARQAMRARA